MSDIETCETITVTLRGETRESAPVGDETILEAAIRMGLRPRYACLSGECAACIARVVEGSAEMRNNQTLNDYEVSHGYVLTCQACPTSRTIKVVFEE